MGYGTLQVKLFATIGGALPVSDTLVLIKAISGETLYNLYTDKNGLTDRVVLYAPEGSSSQVPNNDAPRFAIYNVEVIPEEKYKKANVNGVQIFDKVDSTLPIQMLPSIIGESEAENTETYNIPLQHGVDSNK